MKHLLMVVLCLSLATMMFAVAEQADKPLVAVPDFFLMPADKFDDPEMGLLAAGVAMAVLEERFTVLERPKLLEHLQAKNIAQTDLFKTRDAVATLAELGCAGLVMGRIEKKGDKYELSLALYMLSDAKMLIVEGRQIEKSGDLPNHCREMSKELVSKFETRNDPTPSAQPSQTPRPLPGQRVSVPENEMKELEKTLVTFEVPGGSFAVRLFPREAPLTCRNFVALSRAGFYNGTAIHRVIKGRIVQMGALDRENGGSVPKIPNEFNDRPHARGTIAMARNPYEKDLSHGNQFYACVSPLPKLDRNFTVFGHIVSGMEIVDKLCESPTGKDPAQPFLPDDDLKITSATISTVDAPFDTPPMLPPMITIKDKGTIIAEVETSMGTFKMRFYPEKAPRLVANFLDLAQRRFYDGLIWHRVVTDFVIQTGDPNPDDPYVDEAPVDIPREMPSDLKHLKGAVAMAKRGNTPPDVHSASQFYVCIKEQPNLDGKYAVFGQVYEGMDVVEKIGDVAVSVDDKPLNPVYVRSIRILNLGDKKLPGVEEGGAVELVPATPDTPHSKTIAVIATDRGDIMMKFYADKAPKTVANFISLARRGFYDGMYIHRVASGKIVQFGDPKTNGQTEPPRIPDELVGLSHYQGTVAMANIGEADTATCQFFVNASDNMEYNKSYTVFAEVIQGLDLVTQLSNMRVTDMNGMPDQKVFFSVKLMKLKE